MEGHSNKGIIYCRVSSHDQVQGTSLDNQKRACLEYAGNKGVNIENIFIEKGESATAANRTEFLKALDYCREHKGKINAFIVWKIDRFARNTTDHFAVRAKLIQYGITLHSVTEPISQDPQGKLMETLLAGFAEFENEVRKQRCTAGMQGRLREGIWPWHPPIGYVHSKKATDRRKLRPDEPDPERFYLIQKALKAYATRNYTIIALTDLMNKWGLRTRTGKPMRKQLVEANLKDRFYAGIIVDPWTGEEYKGQHQPMITLEEYHKIRYIKDKFSRLKNIPHLSVHPDFSLRRFVSCICKQKLTAGWVKGRNKKYPYYSCKNPECRHYFHGIPKPVLEEKFVELLQKVTPKEKFLRYFEAVVIDTWKSQYATFKQERQLHEQRLKRLEERKKELEVMRMNREITPKRFLELKDELDNQITAIQISRNEAKIDELDIEAAVSYTVQFIRNLARQWQDMKDVTQKQRLQRLVFPEGLVYDKSSGTFGTAVLSPIFKLNEEFSGDESGLVAGVGRIWHQLVHEIKEIYSFYQKDREVPQGA